MLPGSVAGGASSSASISSSCASESLWPCPVEELDAVVLGRVVGRRDDDPEVEREQRDRRRRQHAAEHGVPAGGDDAASERLLELGAGPTRVAADEDATAARTSGVTALPELLDQLRRERLADDAANAVGSEVPTAHGPAEPY